MARCFYLYFLIIQLDKYLIKNTVQQNINNMTLEHDCYITFNSEMRTKLSTGDYRMLERG